VVVLTAALVLSTPAALRADPIDTTVETATEATATAPAPTTATTTATTPTTPEPATSTETTAPEPAGATLAIAGAPQSGCPPVGAVGLLLPHQRPVVLAPDRQLTTAQVAYPADGSILTAAGLSLDSACSETRPTGGTAQVRGVSLFGGAVTARSATVSLSSGGGSVSGLAVNGKPTTLVAGHAIRIGNWGYLIAPDPAAASRSAFEVELSSEHAGLPAGTLIFVPYARIEIAPSPPQTVTQSTGAKTTEETNTTTSAPVAAGPAATHDEPFGRPASKRVHFHPRKPRHPPLTITPPLLAGPYVFPVGGNAFFGDSYGGPRSDVSGGWHHGDDIFAPLGTPVVAVADGTLNRIGWQRLGGWRLWVRDKEGDQFYYAHLSGYSPLALASKRVHRGDVIGFVGNTGDAFTTLPHLHFEIHPRELLHLHYHGAVNPTGYLQSWPRPGKLDAPRPVHPRLPRSAMWRHEATVNFRELLAARGLLRPSGSKGPAAALLPPVPAPDPDPMVAAIAPPASSSTSGSYPWPGLAAGGACSLMALGFALWRRRLGV
jgi:murein DD-endopeptidase MepM/ murein hydrolase activator NlpD